MFTAYFDASGSPDDTSVVSLVGLLSTTEKWIAFSNQWEECLCAFGVSALHMKHFAHSENEFSAWRNDEPRRRRFLSGLMYAIEHHVEYTVACTVLMDDYKSVDQRYRLSDFMRPYTFAASTCVSAIIPWTRMARCNPREIGYIFEKGDPDQADVQRCWEELYPDAGIRPLFLRKVDRLPSSEDLAPIRPFEAADLVAYENHKANIRIEGRGGTLFLDELRKPMQRLFHLPGAKEWRYSNVGDLEKVCMDFRVSVREGGTA
jgi:hypothetical protein